MRSRIAELERVEERLRESEATIRSMAEASPDHVMLLEPDGTILFINRTVPDLTVEEVLGRPVFDFIPPEQHEVTRACLQRVIESGQPDAYDTAYPTPHGGLSHFESRVGPVMSDGDVVALAVFSTDITERLAGEERLRHSQKMQAVGQLAGGVAHDFNNVVVAILANAEFAGDTLAPDHPARRYLDEVRIAAERAARLTRQLLAFTRPGGAPRSSVDLRDVVGQLLEMLARLLPSSVHVEVVNGHEAVLVKADPGQLEQVVVNLCLNARDALPDGGDIRIEATAVDVDDTYARSRPWAPPGRHALLRVSDDGQGMSTDVLARVFEPFFTTKEQGRGTGLGLSTAYAIVEQHGGLIHAESAPGRGTVFEVYLPLAEPAEESRGAVSGQPVVGGHENVLVAEDDQGVRTVVEQILTHAGYEVAVASDGAEALALFEQAPDRFELVILDMVMPRMGGREAWERMVALRPDVRVLISSGYAAEQLPADGPEILPKPYVAAALLRMVREVLDRPS